jgi:hypothetical protein
MTHSGKKIVPVAYEQAWYEKLINWIKSLFSSDYEMINSPQSAAEEVVVHFASKAYRRFIKENEKEKLLGIFNKGICCERFNKRYAAIQ